MRWTLAATALTLLVLSQPAIGSFHETMGVIPERIFPLAMQGTSFNGLHAPQAPLLEAYLGERVRFAILAAEAHTFHLHGHPWLVNATVVDTFLVNEQTPHTFDVFAGGVDEHPGDWMYHCHIDLHMAGGMWGIFRVYPFMTQAERVGNTIDVTLTRLGEALDGAQLTLSVDGIDVPAHVEPRGDGVYLVHARLPAAGALVVTATHPEFGVSVARASLDGGPVPALTVTGAHMH